MGSDVLVQIHIPKCAGTSVGVWLRNAAALGVISGFRALYPDYVYADENLGPAGFDDVRVAAVSTHNIRRFLPASGDRRLHYFTLLRDPRAHFLSVVRYMIQERPSFSLPAELPATSQDVAAWLLASPLSNPFRENPQTNHLALHVWSEATGERCTPERYGSWAPADQAAYERERLEVAQDVLRSFLGAGTVERLGPSLEVVRERSRAFGIELLPVEYVPRTNVTRLPWDDVSWIDHGALAERFRAAYAVDFALHAYAGRLLDEALAARRPPVPLR